MWITRLSPITIGIIVLGYLFVFIVLPNILLRNLVQPGLIRPTFFVAAEISLLMFVIFGLYGEGSKQFYDNEYSKSNGRMQKFILIAILAAIFIVSSVPIVARQANALVAVYLFHAPLREVTATIKYREGLAMTFIFADSLRTTDGQLMMIPYSDMPEIGGTYTFTMLPTENVVTYYQAVDH